MEYFVTADEHYGHRNMIEYLNRPFASVEEMTEKLIENHNRKVPDSRNYTTVHVGDLFWRTLTVEQASEILDRLHGLHEFVWGNHDELIEGSRVLRDKFVSISHMKKLYYNKRKIILCHYAMRVWNGSHKGSGMLYGHSHGELPPLGKSFDIGVDCQNFEPLSLSEVSAKLDTMVSNHVITNVWPGKE